MIASSTLRFLKSLSKNNNKPWFDANRPAYEAAKKDVAALTERIIAALSKKDPSVAHLTAKDCMFRINRDVRFSKNKSPYKTNMGAFINPGGKKAFTAGYYLHIEPGGIFAGGGLYMPEPELLKKVRQEIDYNLPAFEAIIRHRKFKQVFEGLDERKEYTLSRVPKGYEADNPAAPYLKLKSFVATATFEDAQATTPGFERKVLQAFETLQPLNVFLNEALQS